MRIAIAQTAAQPLDVEANLMTLRSEASAAHELGAELVLTPELFLTGYVPDALAGWLTGERVAGIPAAVAEIAAGQSIAIAASFPLARADGSFVIAAALWDASGRELLRYEKVHLWGEAEARAFSPGVDAPGVVQWNGRRVGFQICYDIEFAEPVRSLALRGADLVLVPTAIDHHSDYVPQVLVRARAAENSLVVAYADHPAGSADAGADAGAGGAEFAGLSTIAGREGRVLAQAGRESTLLCAELPEVEPVRAGEANYLSDRRPELYTSWGAAARSLA